MRIISREGHLNTHSGACESSRSGVECRGESFQLTRVLTQVEGSEEFPLTSALDSTLIATNVPVDLCRAKETRPKLPVPSMRPISKLGMSHGFRYFLGWRAEDSLRSLSRFWRMAPLPPPPLLVGKPPPLPVANPPPWCERVEGRNTRTVRV